MIVKPFQISDYFKARIARGLGLEFWDMRGGVFPILQYMENSGTFWTLWRKDTVVLIAGYYQAFDGVCEVTLYPTEEFIKRPMGAVLIVKKRLLELRRQFRRIQLNCRQEPLFVDFAQWLGFTYEGTLRNFGYDGRNHNMMSIVRKENVSKKL